jgi:hypothetical protein
MDFFKGIEHDARAVLNAAQQQTRKYERDPSKKVETFKPDYARFKAVIYFRNGQNRYFYSYDTVNSQDGSFIDEYVGLTKLLRLILNKKTVILVSSFHNKQRKNRCPLRKCRRRYFRRWWRTRGSPTLSWTGSSRRRNRST